MSVPTRVRFFAMFLILATASLSAQTPAEPAGHWEGAIRAGEKDVLIEVDLGKGARGELLATFTNAGENVRGLPLSNVSLTDHAITFEIKATGGGMFRATIDDEGKSMKGTFSMQTESRPIDLPFHLTRTGASRLEPAHRSAAIAKGLEGRWTGTMDVNGTPHDVGLLLVNEPDGSATGVVISREGLQIPITLLTQKGSTVTLDVKTIGASFSGELKGGEVAGTWTQGPFVAPLTFHRAAAQPVSATLAAPVERWAKAVGGREKIASIKAIYREATVQLGGVTGSIKVWRTPDGKYRKEEQAGTYSTIETFDGESAVVREGTAAPRAMAGAELQRARSTGFANWNAVFFAFFPERRRGTLSIEDDITIVLKPEGGIDWRVSLDPRTSLPATMIHQQGDRTVTVTFAAYEAIDGLQFEKEIRRTTGDPRFDSVIRFTKTVINPPISATIFALDATRPVLQ